MPHKFDKFIDTTYGAMKYTAVALGNGGKISENNLFALMHELDQGPKEAEVIKYFAERRARDFMAEIAAVRDIGDLGWSNIDD